MYLLNFGVDEGTNINLRAKYRQALETRAKNDTIARLKKAEADRAENQARVDYETERSAWIAEHGSIRLQRLVAEGISHNETYLHERLAADHPGWSYYENVCGKQQEICDATDSALGALDEARQTAPDAILGWLNDDCHLDGCAHEGILCPGPALFANFLGHQIIRTL